MVFFRILKIAFRNVRLNWHHSLVSLLSISVGFVALTVFDGYIKDIENAYVNIFSKRSMFGDIIVDSSLEENVLDVDALRIGASSQKSIDDFLNSQESLKTKVRFLSIEGSINNSETTTVFSGFGYDVQQGAKMRTPKWQWDVIAGMPLDLTTQKRPILLGKDLGRALGCQKNGPAPRFALADGFAPEERPFQCSQNRVRANVTTASGQFNAADFEVSGLISQGFQEADSSYVLVPLEDAQKLLKTKEISFYTLALHDVNQSKKFIEAFNKASLQSGWKVKASHWKDHRFGDLAVRSMEFLYMLRNFIVSIIFVIVFVSVFSSLVKSIGERKREVGTMRSMGYPKPLIVSLFAGEGFFLACLGCGVGMLLTWLLYIAIDKARLPYRAGILSEPDRLRIVLTPEGFVQSAFLLCSLVALTATLATRRLTKQRIPENLE